MILLHAGYRAFGSSKLSCHGSNTKQLQHSVGDGSFRLKSRRNIILFSLMSEMIFQSERPDTESIVLPGLPLASTYDPSNCALFASSADYSDRFVVFRAAML